MPDITMCKGEGCPQKDDCYRFKAKPSEYRQAYFVTPPMNTDGSCRHHLPMAKYKDVFDE